MANEEVKATLSNEDVNDLPVDVPVVEVKDKDGDEDEVATVTKNVVEDNATVECQEVTQPIVTDSTDEKVETIVDVGRVEFTENEIKALAELKNLVQAALNNHEFSTNVGKTATDVVAEVEVKKVSVEQDGTKTVEAIEETVVSVVDQQQQQQKSLEESVDAVDDGSSPPAAEEEEKQQEVKTEEELPEEVSIWGVPLMKDERTDTILWKFLRARDFKPNEAFKMLKNTIKWREEFQIDTLLNEDLGKDLTNKVAFMHGFSKEGNPVCYNVYGAFQDKELYLQTFSDEVKRHKFLKWRVQLMEKSIRNLDFSPNGGINTIVQVNDLKNSPGPGKWELRQATKHALQLFQDNYPEFVAKQVFINVPWWYVAVNKMISPFLTQRTKSKFVVAGPSKSAQTLFNYIAPEQVPIRYGGLSKTGELSVKDGVTQIIVKPSSKEIVEFAVTEACQLRWEVRVVGWEVSYGAEFVPNNKDNYIVIIQKQKKIGSNEETIITNNFKTNEPGKVVLTIHNSSSKKKTLLYRLKPITLST